MRGTPPRTARRDLPQPRHQYGFNSPRSGAEAPRRQRRESGWNATALVAWQPGRRTATPRKHGGGRDPGAFRVALQREALGQFAVGWVWQKCRSATLANVTVPRRVWGEWLPLSVGAWLVTAPIRGLCTSECASRDASPSGERSVTEFGVEADRSGEPEHNDGVAASTSVPSPSCPMKFWPQQRTVPSDMTAHECCVPAAIEVTADKPVTGVGVERLTRVLSPSCPSPLLPQQRTAPSLSRAQVCPNPPVTATAPARLATTTGVER